VKRPTIADIARAAGVSKGAVSYALNGRPGVSEPTRRRILAIAEDVGWQPSSAARALSGGRSGAIGLIVDRPASVLGVEPYFMQMISGIQASLGDGPPALLLQMADDRGTELGIYRRWWAERRVDGVLLVDLRTDDPRIGLVREIGLPAVVIGGPDGRGDLPCVWSDDALAMADVLGYLAALGHRRVVRVAGPADLVHTRSRSTAFTQHATRQGLVSAFVHTDYSAEAAATVVRRLLVAADPPTALVFDNDVMAVAALGVAQELGRSVPGELSIVAWDDSALCQVVRPALTAVRRPITQHGAAAVTVLLEMLHGGPGRDVRVADPVLVPRASTGRAVEWTR
jgi:DNA-binding LacI/PurR family transcriptional regulator